MPRPKGPEAPHGYDDKGVPLAPYGLKVDGTPRTSRRGATAGGFGNSKGSTATASVKSLTDIQRKGMLCDLVDSLIVTPLASASQVPVVVAKLGRKQTEALAADAFVLSQYAPHLADGLIVLSKSKPGALAWLDRAEQNAPYMLLAQVGIQMAKALVQNHLNPNTEFAAAGRSYANMRLQAMAAEINRQANSVKTDQQGWAEQAEAEQREYAEAMA